MRLKNTTLNSIIHLEGRTLYKIHPNEELEVPEVVAKIWKNVVGIVEIPTTIPEENEKKEVKAKKTTNKSKKMNK